MGETDRYESAIKERARVGWKLSETIPLRDLERMTGYYATALKRGDDIDDFVIFPSEKNKETSAISDYLFDLYVKIVFTE